MRLGVFLALAVLLHGLLALFWLVLDRTPYPLAGGGEVSVEIVTSPHPDLLPQGEKESFAPAPSPATLTPRKGGEEGEGSGSETGADPLLAAIRQKIERSKRYPLLARKSGIEGRSLVRFQIGDAGQAEGIGIKDSSGSLLLDGEAVETIRRAAPFPPYKDPLEIWIRFDLNP